MSSVEIIARTTRDRLGEGPTWLERRGELAWVDIVGHSVHLFHHASNVHRTVTLEEPVGWVLPRRNAGTVMAGLRSGFAIAAPYCAALKMSCHEEGPREDTRIVQSYGPNSIVPTSVRTSTRSDVVF